MNKIEIRQVSKNFGDTTALDKVSVDILPEKIYGLLGRNGAGKSTLLNVISNRIFADNGAVLVDGVKSAENDKALSKVYLMSEKNYYPEDMKVKEIFKWTKEFYGNFDTEKAYQLSELFGLNVKQRSSKLSTGYASIFKIILALCLDIPYIFLDEPVLGLDANHREMFYKLLLESYAEKPRTFVISTHLIEEISSLIEDVIIIKNGKVIKDCSSEELLSSGYTVSGAAEVVDAFTKGKEVIGADMLGGLKSAYVIGTADKSQVLDGLEITKLDMQKLFIQLTNS
ncbi:ATP-binding cassette domain-containing protein [Scatolibacter rhodanostii]|uniref:ATP-binding cassette domain-containing protein n=1 Tax=Scatolibacter rhodanostii TaxID=2014781 RepID=UPI000C06E464|nr:ABC transporter ATP-binding protein [Scatolibacter rhodanostii]